MMIYVTDDNAHAGDFTFLQAEGSTPKSISGAPEGTTVMYRGRIDQAYDHIFTHYDTWIDDNADNASEWVTDCAKQPSFTETMPPPQSYILPKNEWSCIQWHMKESSDHIDIHLNRSFLSATQVNGGVGGDNCENDLNQGGMWFAPEQFDRLHVGVEQDSNDALPRTMYIDDVVVDNRYVECGDHADGHTH